MDGGKRKFLPNPREKANLLSIIFFWWTLPLFRKGYANVLDVEDIYQPLSIDRSESLGERLENVWQKEYRKAKRPSLLRTIAKTFWKEYTAMALQSLIVDVVIRLTQPLLLGTLLLYFRKGSEMTHDDALMYGAIMVILAAMNGIIINHYYMAGFHNGLKVRVSVCSLIYKKALRLSQTALGDTAPGKVVNLLSNDVNRFDIVSIIINAMWTAPLMTFIAGYILWREVQWAGMFGIAIIFIVVPIQSYTGKLSSKYRSQTALCTDERVRFMDEIISGIQVIKMYAWERPFTHLITLARRLELKVVQKSSYIRAIYMAFVLFTTRMALFCTVLAIVLLYGQENITVAKIFMITALFNAISHAMTQMFVRGVAELAEAMVAFKRLQNFLEYEEKNIDKYSYNTENGDLNEMANLLNAENLPPHIAVSIKDATARWILSEKPIKPNTNKYKIISNGEMQIENVVKRQATLQNIDLEIVKGKLIGVIGPVGAGKSSFLQAILRELPLESGSININGKLSYASQEPWVFAGSIRQNILFGLDMNRGHYDAVIKSCALIKDFEQFENGDLTIIGERGASLSGGQKARVSLARAIYRKADIYLLDDPLSAVDAHVGVHLFGECFGPKGYIARQNSNATRILVTHQVHFLKDADWIIVFRDGKIEIQGTNNDILNSGVDFSSLMASADDDDDIKQNENEENLSRSNSLSSSKRINSIGSLNSVHSAKENEKDLIEEKVVQLQALESSSKGKVKGPLLINYLNSAEQPIILFILFIMFLLAQFLASGADFWVAYWTKQEELRTYYSRQNNITKPLLPVNYTESLSSNTTQIFTESNPHLLSTKTCAYIHGSIMAALFIIALNRSMNFYRLCVMASQKLHDSMFKGLISTSMRFFETNSSGRILNRFSKDMGATDEYLSKAILDATQINLIMVGAILVTIIVNPIFAIPIFLMIIVFVFVRKVYLKSSKDIKRLEGITKSPVFTHISTTLGGLSTIRAFNAEQILTHEFDTHQDLHTSCWYMYLAAGSGFGMVLDVMVIIFIFCVIFFFLIFDTDVSGDKVGLAITQSMALTGLLQWGIRQSAEVTNQLMAVERILEYRDLEPEKQPDKPLEVPKDWPCQGKIEFRNVFYRYFEKADPVLHGLSFSIQPKEKIGIVGRTGAGKSSLIGSLFRLACIDGEILIDDIDTSTLKLSDLRSKLAIIPQDPVLFSGTLRRNLDPFEEYDDSDIWNALDNVELKEIAKGPLGLQATVMAQGSNFSVGQRQLLCLARAILRKNRILILDEATANVDPRTDLLIQQTIREKFADCTVLTVAHRLHTIIDSDRVLVMDSGAAIEFDTPYRLLQQRSGIFKSMIEALGSQEFDRLFTTAKNKFNIEQNS